MSYADIVMDLVAHRVTRAGKPVHLGPTEFRLLRHFMEHPGRVFSREQLLDAVWGKDVYVEARTVDVHIRRLRMALNGEQPGRPDPHRARRGLRARRHAGLILRPLVIHTRQSRFCSVRGLNQTCPFPAGNPTPRSGMGRFPRLG